MQLLRATDLGLRVLITLARPDAPDRASVAELAVGLAVPQAHLAKVVQTLARNEWVTTRRGRTGGVSITGAGLAASTGAVVRAFEGEASVVNCEEPPCPLAHGGCRLRTELDRAQQAFLQTLDVTVIADLVPPQRVGV